MSNEFEPYKSKGKETSFVKIRFDNQCSLGTIIIPIENFEMNSSKIRISESYYAIYMATPTSSDMSSWGICESFREEQSTIMVFPLSRVREIVELRKFPSNIYNTSTEAIEACNKRCEENKWTPVSDFFAFLKKRLWKKEAINE